MRFSRIEIKNYRQYRSLSLSFEQGNNDLHIIVGDNGTGKTNLLNAFTWCLYGVEPHLGNSSKDKGEPRLNKEALLEAAEKGTNLEKVSVCLEIEDEDKVVRVLRVMPYRINLARTGCEAIEKTADEDFSIVVLKNDGTTRDVHRDTTESYIDAMLPQSIREYFFFDGEQLNDYFSPERNGNIKGAVLSISNIDRISQMRKRTETVAEELMKKAKNSNSENIGVLLAKVREYEERAEKHEAIVEKANAEVARIESRINELEECLRGLPEVNELEAKRGELKLLEKQQEMELESAKEAYCKYARKAYIDLAFYGTALEALGVIEELEKGRQLPPPIDRHLLRKMLETHECEVCKRPLSDDDEHRVEELLELYRVSTETSNLLTGMRNELRNLVSRVENYPKERSNQTSLLKKASERLDKTTKELSIVDNTIATCTNIEQIKAWAEERERLEGERRKKEREIGKEEGWIIQFRNAATKQKKEYEREKSRQGLGDEFQQAGDFGVRAAEILAKVEREMITETREMIEKETESLFKDLVWKEAKCERIELSDNYQLTLYDKYGFSCAGTCSAAERALLALSFTLAMHKVSGFQSPLFIDTPIARASGDNRANFAKTLAGVSKDKQLILTFTPDEYSESIASVFDPIAASNRKLVLDEGEKTVSVRGEA